MKTFESGPAGEGGVALAATMLVVMVIGAFATGAALVGANRLLAGRHLDRMGRLEAAADAGLERAHEELGADKSAYPDVGYRVLETDVSLDGLERSLEGATRTTFVGRRKDGPGPLTRGGIVSIVTDDRGNSVAKYQEVHAESFARFAYFTDREPSGVSFGSGHAIFGPVHSNDHLKIYSSGASFYSSAQTAKSIEGAENGYFAEGYQEKVRRFRCLPFRNWSASATTRPVGAHTSWATQWARPVARRRGSSSWHWTSTGTETRPMKTKASCASTSRSGVARVPTT